jgi:hypothetical protein
MQADADAMRPAAPAGATAAKMVALVDQADRAFAPPQLSSAEAERIADALEIALDDDDE